jgi:hypothetical protein
MWLRALMRILLGMWLLFLGVVGPGGFEPPTTRL